MPRSRPLILAVGASMLLAGCHGPKPKTSAISAESHAPGTTLASTPAACAAYPAGSPGVVRLFCNGPAVVKLTIDGADHLLKGGSCETSPAGFSLNLGVVSGPGLAGPKPDYVGLTVTGPAGPFTDAVVSLRFGGKVYALPHNSGQIGPTGGAFSGVSRHHKSKVSVSFTC